MVKNVTLTIDHKSITVPETTTILEAARMLNINIPTLCYLKDVNEIAACRLCCVEVKGMERLVPACDNVVADGMEVFTNSPMAREARRANLRLILSEHDASCTSCSRSGNCTLQSLANDFNMRGEHYPTKLRREAVDYSTPLIRENDKCVKCMRCIQICENVQTVKIWDLLGTGSRATVDASRNRRIQDTECTYCGQCITHCPTAALRERDDTGIVFDAIDDPNTVTVVQVAPAVRAAWAEQFNLSPEFATPKRMAAALRELGFNYVFDTDFAADLTIMEEGSEFLERFTHKKDYRWPMFTSCCPGWVRFLKSQYPERTEELSTAKSPQQMFGAIAKTYFAEKIGIDPKRLFVVSIMPCVAKKYECDVPELSTVVGATHGNGTSDAGLAPDAPAAPELAAEATPDVDAVLTVREFGRLLRMVGVDCAALDEVPFDNPLGLSTGAATIFGRTGGVMEAHDLPAKYTENDPGCAINELLTLEQIGTYSAMYQRGELTGCIVEGPISYDCAVSREIAAFKGFESPCAGDCDVLVAPNIHAGNIMGKMLTVTCGAKMAGFIVGAKCPIVMTSRGSSAEEKYLSIVISAAAARNP